MTTHSNASKTRKCQNRPTVQRLKQIETYRQIKAEAELAERIETSPIFSVIRNNQFVDVSWLDLTEGEKRSAYNNAFYTYSEGA